ncbi:MAG: hypothetical protein SOI57_00285 [Leuconostoc gelidum]|jgi:chemotaxis regulatin CheY-phosphate phosphatase CheZ|uniref:hypothetical protein n=2 Tax=Leuconostoc gelidum TaxID=1244 RepID=UPI0015752791|nr:hypothetical protein [Leuconostoc gelidum]QDJ29844.1 hypothetical protein BHS02_03975 [Leuconostoc gelidum subsp. gelidum]
MNDEPFNQTVTNYFKNDYRERGKIKWQGYFLSDHTLSLNHDSNDRHQVTKKLPRMPLDAIKIMLRRASVNYNQVIVQQDYQDTTDHMLTNVTGLVAGFSDRGVMVNQEHILFENIRAVVLQNDRN